MATVQVNGQDVTIGDGERLNCIQAAAKVGVEIPHYCWHKDLSVVASCRMCLVEMGDKKPDGTIAMQPKLVPGCQTPVKDGSVIITNSDKVKAAEAGTLEFLLLNHPLDCPVCDQAGECYLQDYSYKYGRAYSRMQEPKLLKADKDHIGDQITLFTDRCVMCTRCVRFTKEISGTSELQVVSRGNHAEIDIFPGEPCNNKLAGNVVDICPVGALCSKDFLYEQRVWWLKGANSVCPGCSTGCSIRIDQNKDVVYRLKPRENPQAQGSFMCDDGRFGWKYIQDENRLRLPVVRSSGTPVEQAWDRVLPAVKLAIEESIKRDAGRFAAVLSPWMTVEEAFLLAKWVKSLSPDARLVMGPVAVVGEDDLYPKGLHGEAPARPKFTIRAEKCPNRLGVELVLKHFEGEVISFADAMADVGLGRIDSLFAVGGDPAGWVTPEQAAQLAGLRLLIVQDILQSAASEKATFVLPGSAWAERDGTFINHNGLAQGIMKAVRGPGESRADSRILFDLAGRKGLVHIPTLRKEIGAEIPALAALVVGQLGETGVSITTSSVAVNGAGVGKPVGAAG
jgi:NADH-quinone oxidoreductase subunit G